MKLTHHSDRHWERVIKSLALAIAVGGLALLVPGGGPAQAASPTLEAIQGLPQDWDKTLPANDPGGACPSNSSRFTCVMGGAAVRGTETGLVWEKSPNTTAVLWGVATHSSCADHAIGGRKGWRLPSQIELASLVDPSVGAPGPTLPAGHPFTNVQSDHYWSATTVADSSDFARVVSFQNGGVTGQNKTVSSNLAWCVRGPMQESVY